MLYTEYSKLPVKLSRVWSGKSFYNQGPQTQENDLFLHCGKNTGRRLDTSILRWILNFPLHKKA